MKQSTLYSLLGVIGAGLVAANASATVQYQYVTDTPTIQASPSQVVPVNIFLQEQVTGVDNSILTSEDGLFGAGVDVQRTGTLPTQPAALLGLAPATGANGFNGTPITQVTDADAHGFWGVSLPASTGVTGTNMGGGIIDVLLGTVDVTAGSQAGVTDFTIGGYQDNTLTYNSGYSLDDTSAGPPAYIGATSSPFTVTTVVAPEPSSIGVLLLASGTLIRRRREASAR